MHVLNENVTWQWFLARELIEHYGISRIGELPDFVHRQVVQGMGRNRKRQVFDFQALGRLPAQRQECRR
jgi:hypothetical protein